MAGLLLEASQTLKTNQRIAVLGHRLEPLLHKRQASISAPRPELLSDPSPVQRSGQSGSGWRGQGPMSPPRILSVHFPFILSVKSLPVQH